MSKLLKSKILLGIMLVAVMAVGTIALAQQAVVSASDIQYAETVRQGSSGQSSLIWQKFLNDYSSANLVADGKFGPLSAAAAKIWQASRGLVVDGVMGAMSRASAVAQINSGIINPVGGTYPAGCSSNSGYSVTTGSSCSTSLPAGCTSTIGFSPTTGAKCDGGAVASGPLSGSNGEIADINQLSQYSGEEVGSGSNDIKVLGFDVKASKDGDIKLNTIKLVFDANGYETGDSTRITDYLDSLIILEGSTEVGSANLADFNKDSTGVYSKTITLNNAVVRNNTTEKFYVAVDAVSNLDSGDIDNDSWTVGIGSIRYEDGAGVVTTYTATEIHATAANIDWLAANDGVAISFVSFSAASDTEFKISADSSNPESSTIKVSTSINTDNVVLLKGKIKLSGTSDVWLDELPFEFTTTSSSISAVTGSVKLTIDGKEFTESTGGNCVNEAAWTTADSCDAAKVAGIVFDNLDLTIEAGSTIYFTLSADINDIEDTALAATDFLEGGDLLAKITTTATTGARAAIVAENSEAEQLVDITEMTGSITGNAQVFRSTGLTVSLVSTSATVTLGDPAANTPVSDSGTFVITFDVTASGNDIWVDKDAPVASGGTTESDLDVLNANGTLLATIQNISGGSTAPETVGSDGFVVRDGTTQRFVITSHILATTSSGYHNVSLTNLRYALTDVSGTTSYTTGLTSFKTNNLYLNDY